MSNMSYCRFQNTYQDLQDCVDNWNSLDKISEDEMKDVDEIKARERIIELAREIIAIEE
jgi:hypothetical protein